VFFFNLNKIKNKLHAPVVSHLKKIKVNIVKLSILNFFLFCLLSVIIEQQQQQQQENSVSQKFQFLFSSLFSHYAADSPIARLLAGSFAFFCV
jgi:hypothetical protein